MTSRNLTSIVLVWDPPVHLGGHGLSIQKYIIRISEINYFVEESGTVHLHKIESAYVMFNKLYNVEVIAVNTCDIESNPANVSMIIKAQGELACVSYF